jgi:hypothetical protein
MVIRTIIKEVLLMIAKIILKHTDFSIADYTGASLQSVLTHNNTKLTYKLTIFFGYSSSRNSISHSLDITEKQYLSLIKEINKNNKQILANSNAILSDEELYGADDFVRTSSRTLNDPTILTTTTLNTTTSTTSVRKFKKPTVKEVAEYCKERKNTIDAETFIDYFESSGWIKANGQKVKDWKATIRTWEKRSAEKQSQQTSKVHYLT